MNMNQQRQHWPIIIGGVHRSGTSLVRRILNSHSHIYCGPEIKFFKDWSGDYISDPIRHARFFESARSILPDDVLLAIFGKAFIEIHERAAQLSNKQRWADKNPENILYLNEWQELLGEQWLFIHVVRNPLDTLASINEANFKYSIPSDLDARIDFYKKYSEAGLDYSQKHSDRSYRVLYEKLVTTPEAEVGQLMQWLGESMETIQLKFNTVQHQGGLEDPKIANTANVHTASIGRWKNDLAIDQAKQILEQTISLWERLDPEQYYPLRGF
jgi:hypothetical protein